MQQEGRSDQAAGVRKAVKTCRSKQSLMRRLASAERQGLLDTSVLAASLQTCGYHRWWKALQEVMDLGARLQIPFNGIATSVLFRALLSCVQAFTVSPQRLSRRKTRAFRLARQVMGNFVPETAVDFNALLSSMCRLCDEIGSEESLAWADKEWQRFELLPFETNIVAFAARLQLLERHGRQQEVDQMLRKDLVGPELSPNVVVLGGLVNAAAINQDWQRAEKLWEYLVQLRHVKPNIPAHLAYAKAYMLAGKPCDAIRVVESALGDAGCAITCASDYKVAVEYTQNLVIVCHSLPTPTNLSKLTSTLQQNADLMKGSIPTSAKVWWQKLSQVADTLLHDATQLGLKDVLITSNATTYSVMKDWDNLRAGADYL